MRLSAGNDAATRYGVPDGCQDFLTGSGSRHSTHSAVIITGWIDDGRLAKALYRNTVTDLFGRLKSPRKRVVSGRHVQLLNLLLDEEEMTLAVLTERTRHIFNLSNPYKALVRDLNYLIGMGATSAKRLPDESGFLIHINLDWPTKIAETEFFKRVKVLPKGKVYGFLSA
jgi:hypothetical protein